jgi:hypothetical protein
MRQLFPSDPSTALRSVVAELPDAALRPLLLEPGAHQRADVLAPVKERPGNVATSRTAGMPAVLDSRSTRRRRKCAGRDMA